VFANQSLLNLGNARRLNSLLAVQLVRFGRPVGRVRVTPVVWPGQGR